MATYMHAMVECTLRAFDIDGADRKYIRAKETDIFFWFNFTLSVSFYFYVFSVRIGQTDSGINAPLGDKQILLILSFYMFISNGDFIPLRLRAEKFI